MEKTTYNKSITIFVSDAEAEAIKSVATCALVSDESFIRMRLFSQFVPSVVVNENKPRPTNARRG